MKNLRKSFSFKLKVLEAASYRNFILKAYKETEAAEVKYSDRAF
jgi:hypothetical protein